MLEHLGIPEERARWREAFAPYLYVAPLDRSGRNRPVDPQPSAITIEVLRATADALTAAVPAVPREEKSAPIEVYDHSSAPTPRNVIAAFCNRYSAFSVRPYTIDDLTNPRRSYRLAAPRHVCMLLLKDICGLTLTPIGKLVRRDHTSVMSGIRRVPHHFKTLPALKRTHDSVMAFFAEGK